MPGAGESRRRAATGVERVKERSGYLRGTVAEALAQPAIRFSQDDYHVLKFHGVYQGYDRDSATELKGQGLDKHWQLMTRVRLPGGRLTADQYLVLDALADQVANGTLRITTRQGIQYHGVLKGDLSALIAGVNAALMTTLAACGDVVRNVMAPPVLDGDPRLVRLQADAARLSGLLLPQSRAYHEIWLDGELSHSSQEESEPLYGATYLPRKLKIALAAPFDNTVDVLANDLGFIGLFDGNRLIGYNVAIGGGMGMTHNRPDTWPYLARLTAFILPDQIEAMAQAVVSLARDHGDRTDRRRARLKYLVEEWGVERVRSWLEADLGYPLEMPRSMPPLVVPERLGWTDPGDGTLTLGLPVASGRIEDVGPLRLRSLLALLVRRFRPAISLLATQDIALTGLDPAARQEIDGLLASHGVARSDQMSPLYRWALFCPALPSCGLALTEAERVRESILACIQAALDAHGLGEERISVRVTGCPNGCARPYSGDIGLVGRVPGSYSLYVGGDFAGTRLATCLVDKLAVDAIGPTLNLLFAGWASNRRGDEDFGDWCHRRGADDLRGLLNPTVSAPSETRCA